MSKKSSARELAKRFAKPEEKLAFHLEKAEDHLIEAVKLFECKNKPDRIKGYIERLVRSQEIVTSLYREELIRIRGPIKKRR